MLNAAGYVITQADGHYKGALRTVSMKADIDILPDIQKSDDAQLDFRMMTQVDEFGVGWLDDGEASNKEYVNLSIAALGFRPKKFYANLGKAAGSNDKDVNAAVWDCFDQTKAPVQDLHGGNRL